MLDQHAEKALKAAQNGAMQHHWGLPAAVSCHVFGVEASRKLHVHLERAALPLPPDCVAQGEIQLGAVEGTIPGIQKRLDPGTDASLSERRLRLVPLRIGADSHRRECREFHREFWEAE